MLQFQQESVQPEALKLASRTRRRSSAASTCSFSSGNRNSTKTILKQNKNQILLK